LNIQEDTQVFLVVETGCRYHAEMTFPDMVTAGIRVSRLGSSSVRYEIGLYRNDENTASEEGFFVQDNEDRISRRPTPFGDVARLLLEPLVV